MNTVNDPEVLPDIKHENPTKKTQNKEFDLTILTSKDHSTLFQLLYSRMYIGSLHINVCDINSTFQNSKVHLGKNSVSDTVIVFSKLIADIAQSKFTVAVTMKLFFEQFYDSLYIEVEIYRDMLKNFSKNIIPPI
jgi:hypothetical protein